MDFGKIVSLQIGDERIAFRPTEMWQDFGSAPVLQGEILSDVFETSNLIRNLYEDNYIESGRIETIKDVIFNDPATIVIWLDGSTTVVKCQPGDTYSKETGLAMCIAKKYFGNTGNYNEIFKKWIPDEVKAVKPTTDGFTIGDKVRVIDTRCVYSSYTEWLYTHVTDPLDVRKWYDAKPIRNNDIGVIKYIAPHGKPHSPNVYIAYIDVNGSGYMISTKGLEKVDRG